MKKENRYLLRIAVLCTFFNCAASLASIGYFGIISSSDHNSEDWVYHTPEALYTFANRELKLPRSSLLTSYSATLFDVELMADGIAEAESPLSLIYIAAPIVTGRNCSLVLADGELTFHSLFEMLEKARKPTLLFIDATSISQASHCENSIKNSTPFNALVYLSSSNREDVRELSNLLEIQDPPQISDLGLAVLASFLHESMDEKQAGSEDGNNYGPELSYLDKYNVGWGRAFSAEKIQTPDKNKSLTFYKYSKLLSHIFDIKNLEDKKSDFARQVAAEEAREKVAREKEARKKAIRNKELQENAAREKEAQEKVAREKQARKKATRKKEALEKSTLEIAAREKAAREKAAREKAAREKAAREKAAREKLTQQKLVQEKYAREKAANEARKKKPKISFSF